MPLYGSKNALGAMALYGSKNALGAMALKMGNGKFFLTISFNNLGLLAHILIIGFRDGPQIKTKQMGSLRPQIKTKQLLKKRKI